MLTQNMWLDIANLLEAFEESRNYRSRESITTTVCVVELLVL